MLYYTGAIQPSAIQTDPSKSLGGYISSSIVPNDMVNNLFPNIDYTTISKNLKHTRVIAFLNTSDQEIDSFSLYVNSGAENVSKLKFGLVRNEIDESCDVKYFETLPTDLATPLYVQMQECEGQENTIVIQNIPPGEYVGIFIQRELIPERNPEMVDADRGESCNTMYETYIENPLGPYDKITKDEFEIVINTDDIETNLHVYAGEDRTERLPLTSVTIIGTVTSDYPITEIRWELLSGPNTPTMLNPNSVALTVMDLIKGEYEFSLTAKDFYDTQKSDTMTLTILPKQVDVYYGFNINRLILSEQEIEASSKILANSDENYVLSYPNSPEPVYYWFAEPLTEPVKVAWQDTLQAINNGQIGTSQDLFGEVIVIGKYRFYITNYQTQVFNDLELKK